jgi:ketosteroid isomerase-like protein
MKRRQLLILSSAAVFSALTGNFSRAEADREQLAASSAAVEIAKLDRDFSALSAEKGMPAACLAYFADDGIAFAPRPVNGKKYWRSQKDFPGTLVWTPIFAAVSQAEDLGYTTGPWELKPKEHGPSSFGNYVTIWRKRSRAEWKIALDVGTDNSQPSEPPPELQVLRPQQPGHSREEARHKFDATQRAFFDSARRELGKAILAHAAEDFRVFRDNSLPAVGRTAAQILLGAERGKVSHQPATSRISQSGDLAYSYGDYSEEHGENTERGIYLSIWRTNLNGDWQMMLDLRKKLPAT